ncbi:MAG: cytochrome c biogenesis protein CcsA [Alphaproteobacteria bacterium]|nr:cytochrome c biogenesis protein CcsA [Alphaproteobacteria bacterium]
MRFLARTDVFFFAILWLTVLLVAGTLAQKTMGLYRAQETYFSSWIVWAGGIVPLPGATPVMGLIFFGLLAKLFLQPWRRERLGTIIVHGGALFLLFGGFLTAQFSAEGAMVIPEGGSRNYIAAYHARELAVTDVETGAEIVFSQRVLKDSAPLSDSFFPFPIKPISYFSNVALERREESAAVPDDLHGMARVFRMTDAPREREDEMNRAGLIFQLDGPEESENGRYAIFESMPIDQTITANGREYIISLRKKRTYLPFSIRLLDFEKQVYPGTNTPRAYRSDVVLAEDGREWPARIQMNQPLRYKGYTFYQSSFLQGPAGEEVTVLATVKNIGRLFPYIASIIICIGLLIHLVQRLPPLIGKAALLFLLCLPLGVPGQACAETHDGEGMTVLSYDSFARIPVLHEGRIKPLDTFARDFLTTFSGRASLPDMTAAAWMAELLFDQKAAYRRPVFDIPNPDVVSAIGLAPRKGHHYSFLALSQALRKNMPMLRSFQETPRESLSAAQGQLLDLYAKTLSYFEISRSLSLILPDFVVGDPELAKKLGMAPGQALTYQDMIAKRATLGGLITDSNAPGTGKDDEVLRLGFMLQLFDKDRASAILRIVPPQWNRGGEEWLSPWQVLESGAGSPETASFFETLNRAARAYRSGDAAAWHKETQTAFAESIAMAGQTLTPLRLFIEYHYNQLNPFHISLSLYGAAFMTLLVGGIGLRRQSRFAALVFLCLGALVHFAGLAARIYIMARPPVATLYESVLFVGLIGVLFALVIEWRGRNGLGVLIGALIGATLQFIGTRYAAEGDTMGMLVAVLNTNFWLATHVVTITIGYGCCLVAGVLAHLYLLMRLFAPEETDRLGALAGNILAAGLVALLFATVGTILGGIWADQSWGRFWGWDPKENGAMLICLWLIFLLHGRIAGKLKPVPFAMGMALTTVVVALAWFGVNLLGVGLHSYGFTKGIALNLALFSGAEILFVAGIGLALWRRTAGAREAGT